MQLPPRPPDTNMQVPGNLDRLRDTQPHERESAQDYYESAPWPESGGFEHPQGVSPEEGQGTAPWPGRLPRLILALMVLTALLLVLRFQVFVIRTVNISGLSAVPRELAVKAAGLDRSLFYFMVNEEAVKNGINSNRYLVFERMDKIFPSTINLVVRERKSFAFFTHLGVGYVLSQDGIILEQTRELRDGQDLIQVNGLAVWGQQSPGLLPASTDPAQAEALVSLFHEISLWGFGQQLQALDIAQILSISMRTKDGYAINLGSPDQLHAKIGTVASVVNELRRRQMGAGVIEATLPGEATYLAQP